MSELSDLYQEVILDHNKRPRNFRKLDDANRHAEGYNPLCGDKVEVFLKIEDDVIVEVSFRGAGCAISTASASIMTDAVKGKTAKEATSLFRSFQDLVTGKPTETLDAPELDKLAVFHGVSEYPVRVKCATLAWHTLQAALQQVAKPVSTE